MECASRFLYIFCWYLGWLPFPYNTLGNSFSIIDFLLRWLPLLRVFLYWGDKWGQRLKHIFFWDDQMGVQKIVKCRGLQDMYVGSGKVCSLAWDSNPSVFLLSFGAFGAPLHYFPLHFNFTGCWMNEWIPRWTDFELLNRQV